MTIVFLGAICLLSLILLFVIRFLERSKKLKREDYKDYWQKNVMSCLDDAGKYKLAIIEADKLMDRAFKEQGLSGQTVGERLVSAGLFLSDKDAVWQVHKLRNRLVHEMDVELNLKQTKRALVVFCTCS